MANNEFGGIGFGDGDDGVDDGGEPEFELSTFWVGIVEVGALFLTLKETGVSSNYRALKKFLDGGPRECVWCSKLGTVPVVWQGGTEHERLAEPGKVLFAAALLCETCASQPGWRNRLEDHFVQAVDRALRRPQAN